MGIRLRELYVDLDDTLDDVKAAAAKVLGVTPEDISSFATVRRAVDARRKPRIKFVYTVEISLNDPSAEAAAAEQAPCETARVIEPEVPQEIKSGSEELCGPVVVIGSGPAGLMAALRLAEHGYAPLVIERGHKVEERGRDVDAFIRDGVLSSESNIAFGEGGAGTYSDGKLTHRADSAEASYFIAKLAECGADGDIAVDAKPHVGSDVLPGVVATLRHKIECAGGRFICGGRATKFALDGGKLATFEIVGPESPGTIQPGAVILAPGSSARDTWRDLDAAGVCLEARPTLIGVRVEHPQDIIDKAQYGALAGHPALGAAEYFVSRKSSGKLGAVHTFCMCPGGIVMPIATRPGMISSNGMSRRGRDSGYANAAIITPVGLDEYGSSEPLAGVRFIETLERTTFELGGGDYSLPFQRLGDFTQGRPSRSLPAGPEGTRRSGAHLSGFLPEKVERSIIQAFRGFNSKIHGFMSKTAAVYGFELRTGSPVRIAREKDGTSVSASNLYPAGEGAGYAGGIVSSAVDGLRQATKIIVRHRKPNQ